MSQADSRRGGRDKRGLPGEVARSQGNVAAPHGKRHKHASRGIRRGRRRIGGFPQRAAAFVGQRDVGPPLSLFGQDAARRTGESTHRARCRAFVLPQDPFESSRTMRSWGCPCPSQTPAWTCVPHIGSDSCASPPPRGRPSPPPPIPSEAWEYTICRPPPPFPRIGHAAHRFRRSVGARFPLLTPWGEEGVLRFRRPLTHAIAQRAGDIHPAMPFGNRGEAVLR